MGKINSGILGGFSGKVGPVVGGKWKSIDYMRSYVIPANPNTPAQQTVRTKFSALIVYAKAVLTSLIHTYWDPFHSDMSGFNAFVSKNYHELGTGNVIDSSCVMSQGSLEPLSSLVSATIVGTDVDVVWSSVIQGNGLATDKVACVYYQAGNDILEMIPTFMTRLNAGESFTPTNTPEENDVIFLFTYRGTGSSFVVSDSKAILATT
jgi:hypothetical protein